AAAAYLAAMADPAPGLFSTTTCWPSAVEAPLAKKRPTTSDAEPGVKPTMSRNGRDGYASSANAMRDNDGSIAAPSEWPSIWRRDSVMFSPRRSDYGK